MPKKNYEMAEYTVHLTNRGEVSLDDLVGGIAKAKLLICGPDLYVTVLEGIANLITPGEHVYVYVFDRETDIVPADAVKIEYEELFEYSLKGAMA